METSWASGNGERKGNHRGMVNGCDVWTKTSSLGTGQVTGKG
jgi:hypothetical protein